MSRSRSDKLLIKVMTVGFLKNIVVKHSSGNFETKFDILLRNKLFKFFNKTRLNPH